MHDIYTKMLRILVFILCFGLLLFFSVSPIDAKNEKTKATGPVKTVPGIKDHGVYVKLKKGYVRILPNIVFDEQGIFFIESNNPAHYFLKDVEHFVIYGQYDMSVLTVNPMGFFKPSTLGKPRFAFGKEIPVDVRQQGKDMYIIKPKGLLARGYYGIWINDTAWDFILD